MKSAMCSIPRVQQQQITQASSVSGNMLTVFVAYVYRYDNVGSVVSQRHPGCA